MERMPNAQWVVLADFDAMEAAEAEAADGREMRGLKAKIFMDGRGSNSAWADTFDEKSRNAANRWVHPNCLCGDCNAGIGHEHFTYFEPHDFDDANDTKLVTCDGFTRRWKFADYTAHYCSNDECSSSKCSGSECSRNAAAMDAAAVNAAFDCGRLVRRSWYRN